MRVNARVLWAVVWASSAGSSWVSSAPPPELIDWVAIPGGTFQMGSDDHLEDEMPRHRVEIRPFEMSKTEVTVAQYRACVEAGKCREPRRGGTCNWGKAGMENTALVCVDWDLAQEFAAWAGARLPTEAEWEYAATSAGKERVYPWGDEVPGCGRAIILGCKDGLPEVCSRPSGNTEQGLCDMAASVWEWVEDWYRSGYKDAPADGGPWRVPNGSFFHVMRGGSWMYDASWARAQKRNDFMPGGKAADLGIRLVRSKHSYAKTIEKKTPEATSIGGGGKDFAALAY